MVEENKYLVNEKIKADKVLVIDENGKNLGTLDTKVAIDNAKKKGLDLVLFVPANQTKKLPICKIVNYGKFIYHQHIKQKEARKNQQNIKIKEIKIRPQVGKHDMSWKANKVIDWLKDGYQIKFKIMTFGRIATKKELINQVYDDFLHLIDEYGKVIYPLKQLTPVMYEATFIKK